MDDNESRTQSGSYSGYDTPGEDRIISSNSDAVPSPSETGRQRMETPDPFICGEVNEKPGDDNPALNETLGFDEGKSNTADILRARESAEENIGNPNNETYADQGVTSGTAGQAPYDINQVEDPQRAIYDRRELGEPTEPSERDMLDIRTPNVPPEESDEG